MLNSDFDLLGYFRISIRNACIDNMRRKKLKFKVLAQLEYTRQYGKHSEMNVLMEDERIGFYFSIYHCLSDKFSNYI